VAVLTHTILRIPEALAELGIILLVVAAFVGMHAFVQRRVRSDLLRRHNDVAGYLFSAVGVLYAVVLGFTVVVVWQKYDGTVDNVQNEVDAAANLYHVVDSYPTADRSVIRREIARYAQAVIDVEWPAMERNAAVPESDNGLIEDVAYRVDIFSPRNFRESNAQQEAMSSMKHLFDARRERLVHAAPSVPEILWFALVAGALSMIAFCYIFGVENRPAQLLMTAILVGLIAILFAVIYEFATPFSGSVSISSDGWTFIAQRLTQIR
jgi:Protein of unknown function (DUF4239)